MTDVMPILNQFNIVAKDFDATIEFYCRLGVSVTEASGAANGTRHARASLPGGFILEFDNRALARIYNDVGLMSPLDENRRTWPPTESPSL